MTEHVHDWRVRGDGQMQCRTCFYIAPDRPFAEPEPHEPGDYCQPGCVHVEGEAA